MQPTENKQPAQEELIAHIRKTLKANEEPYNLGAWENFIESKAQPKRTLIGLWSLIGVAALLALCTTLFLYTKEENSAELQLAKSTIKEKDFVEINPSIVKDKDFSNLNVRAVNSAESSARTNALLAKNVHQGANNQVQLVANNNAIDQIEESNMQTSNVTVEQLQTAVVSEIAVNNPNTLAITNEIDEQKLAVTPAEKITKSNLKKKWEMGLMLAPSFGNESEINMGYGLSMAYNFSNKLSVVTGVAFNEISGSKNFPSQTGVSSILLGNKTLAEVSQKVSGIDIPLELKYSFNKNIYANLGISAFTVLGQSRANTFVQGVVVKNPSKVEASSSSSASQGQFANSYIVNQRIIERVDVHGNNHVNFLGFYNFSLGFRSRVLKTNMLAIEPFVKLPIREVTDDNLRLFSTGFKVKVGF